MNDSPTAAVLHFEHVCKTLLPFFTILVLLMLLLAKNISFHFLLRAKKKSINWEPSKR